MAFRFTQSPTLGDVEALAIDAFATIPADLRRRAGDVVIQVEDFPDPETQADMGLASPFDILGLYRGIPIGDKTVGLTPHDVDRVFLYRRPILDYWCETGEGLAHLIRHVMIHEIGHHFGLSDEDMERVENSG